MPVDYRINTTDLWADQARTAQLQQEYANMAQREALARDQMAQTERMAMEELKYKTQAHLDSIELERQKIEQEKFYNQARLDQTAEYNKQRLALDEIKSKKAAELSALKIKEMSEKVRAQSEFRDWVLENVDQNNPDDYRKIPYGKVKAGIPLTQQDIALIRGQKSAAVKPHFDVPLARRDAEMPDTQAGQIMQEQMNRAYQTPDAKRTPQQLNWINQGSSMTNRAAIARQKLENLQKASATEVGELQPQDGDEGDESNPMLMPMSEKELKPDMWYWSESQEKALRWTGDYFTDK